MAEGKLHITFKSSSWFLTQSLPVEVRDASNTLVTRSAGTVDVDVPEGLYIVEATLPGGRRLSEVVSVAAGPPTQVVLQGKELKATGDDDEAADATAVRDAPSVALLEHAACEPLDQHGSTWTFDPVPDPTETPMARFDVEGMAVSTSLPVNPRGKVEERACSVTFRRRAGRVRLDVGFAKQRRVAWTLEGMVKSSDVVSTAELFRNAEEILFEKYQDPPAAALGGLTLHRIGRLRERSGWVENLARDFAWVADGRVLLAALLSNDPDPAERARGLDTLLEVAPRRSLFGDGLALLIKLLRTWPDEAREDERRSALAAITSNPATVDWDAMALTMYDEG